MKARITVQAAASALGMGVFLGGLMYAMASAPQDELEAAASSSGSVLDAQQQAQHTADMARWARRVCAPATATTVQVNGDQVACMDAQGQRVAYIDIAKGLE